MDEQQMQYEDEIPHHLMIRVKNKAQKQHLLNDICRLITEIREEKSFDLRTVVEYTRRLMEIMSKYNEFKGVEKRDFVLHVLKEAAKHHTSGNAQVALLMVIDETVPPMIDLIIKAKNGELDLGDIKEHVEEKVSKCCMMK